MPVLPPATSVWYDLDTISDEVHRRLRLLPDVGDPDTETIRSSVQAAASAIDAKLDRVTPLDPDAERGDPNYVPDSLLEALVRVTIELYRGRDAPTATTIVIGEVESWDPVGGSQALWGASKQRWGLA